MAGGTHDRAGGLIAMASRKPALDAPIEIAKFWKNRRRNESVHVGLSEYEGHCLINVRVYCTGTDGIDRLTPKGVAMGIRKLPELAAALIKAEAKARELGLIDAEGVE
jgi:hypothetical protein